MLILAVLYIAMGCLAINKASSKDYEPVDTGAITPGLCPGINVPEVMDSPNCGVHEQLTYYTWPQFVTSDYMNYSSTTYIPSDIGLGIFSMLAGVSYLTWRSWKLKKSKK